MTTIVDGKALRDKILVQLTRMVKGENLKPKLAIILVGEDEPSLRYIRQKQKAAEQIGATAELIQFPESVNQKALSEKIIELNHDKSITGIIVQLPLPSHLDKEKIISAINPDKDVDGLTDDSPFQPATPLGIMEILSEYKVELRGKVATVLGRSKLVGEPVKKLLEKEGTRVIQIHSQTPKPIDALVQQGDIVISAVGKEPKLVTTGMVKEGAVVIDVGTNVDPDSGKLVGDVDFEKVAEKASLITPVPGGVGPLTVAMLMTNLVKSASLDK